MARGVRRHFVEHAGAAVAEGVADPRDLRRGPVERAADHQEYAFGAQSGCLFGDRLRGGDAEADFVHLAEYDPAIGGHDAFLP